MWRDFVEKDRRPIWAEIYCVRFATAAKTS